MPVDASIALNTRPPAADSTMNSLMGYFQIQNAMRQQQLGQLQLQQQMQQQVQRNNLIGAIQQHPEWIDNDTGLLNSSGQANVLRLDPYSGSTLLKDMQDAAKAQAETSQANRAAQATYAALNKQDAGILGGTLGAMAAPGASLDDNSIEQLHQQTRNSVSKQGQGFIDQEFGWLKQLPVEQRQAAIANLARTPEGQDALSKATNAGFLTSHGGLSASDVTSRRNTDVTQAAETQREREVQTAETGRTQMGLNPETAAAKATATETAKKQADIGQALTMRGQWAKNMVQQIDQALSVVNNPAVKPKTSGLGQMEVKASNFVGGASPEITATNELNSNLAKLSQLGTNDPLAKLKGMTTKAQIDLESAAQGKNVQNLDSLRALLERNRAYYNSIASGHDPDNLGSTSGLSGGVDMDAVAAELARRKKAQ